jgi:CRP-like cAMP-binding protein
MSKASNMIFTIIESVIGHFPDEYRAMLTDISTVRKVAKDETILEEGKYCNHLWFINTGAAKAYEMIGGTDRVTYFFVEHMFFTNYYCWVTSKPSDMTFRAVEACEIVEIDYPKLEHLCSQYHIFDTIGRKMAERLFVQEYLNRKLFLNCTATERYEFIEKERPDIFQRFALKDIASFIGITDVSLSRIRRERLSK